MKDFEWLIAVEEIKQLEAKRCRFLDTRDWDAYTLLHVPEMNHTYGGAPPAYGIAAVVKKLQARMGDSVSIHHLHAPEIELTSPTTAKAVWAMEDQVTWRGPDGAKWLRGAGHYHCDYVKRDGAWLITGRHLTRLWLEEGETTYPKA